MGRVIQADAPDFPRPAAGGGKANSRIAGARAGNRIRPGFGQVPDPGRQRSQFVFVQQRKKIAGLMKRLDRLIAKS